LARTAPHLKRRVLQPTCCNRSEQSTSPCSLFNVIAPRLQRPAAECAPAVPLVCCIWSVAIEASRARPCACRVSQPLPPAAGVPLVCATYGATRSQRAEHVSPLTRRDHFLSATAAAGSGEMRTGSATCVCRILRVAIAECRTKDRTSQSRACAKRLLTACHCLRLDVLWACRFVGAASGASRSQRAEHVSFPLNRRERRRYLRLASHVRRPLCYARQLDVHQMTHVCSTLSQRGRREPSSCCLCYCDVCL
jgi:hypothetical protein